MKALFFDKELYMGMKVIGQPMKEYKMAISEAYRFGKLDELSPQLPELFMVIFTLVDYGREFAIYQLSGMEKK